ncbi:MAG: DUF928 domain-containing protein [Leptolyngbyaceae cyanobacterium]
MTLTPSVSTPAVHLTAALWLTLQCLWSTGANAAPLDYEVRSLEKVPTTSSVAKQVLPNWSPATGRPNRQGNAGSRNEPEENTASQNYPDFGRTGQPDSHAGGAARNGPNTCPATEIPLTVVAPVEAGYGGHTTQATPTLWVYVPIALDANNPITFSLVDADYNPLYEVFQAIEHEPGILKLSLPEDVILEPEQLYRWFFIVNCNDPLGIRNALTVEGWVRRVAPDPLVDMANLEDHDALSVEQRIEWSHQSADNLVWYDALTLLGDGLLANPDDPQLRQAWSELLGYPSVQLTELGDLSSVTLRNCCIPQDDLDRSVDSLLP